MQVTPRLPVHGVYLHSPFVEMRYIRCGAYSAYYPAALFCLMELTHHPYFSYLEEKINEVTQHCSGSFKRLLSVSMDESKDSGEVMRTWNGFDQFEYPFDHTSDINELWKGLFGVQLVRYGYEDYAEQDMYAIYWDQERDGNGVVVLYREYSMDSFVVVPECGHIYLKAELFRRMRDRMGHPQTRAEAREIAFQCEGKHCRTQLSDFVFTYALQECTPSPLPPNSPVKSAFPCQRCKIREPEINCTKTCLLCVQCAAISSTTLSGFCCCLCKSRYLDESIDRIITTKQSILGIRTGGEAVVTCLKCKGGKPRSEYKKIGKTKHRCWLCDDCFPGVGDAKWPCCGLDYEVRSQEISSGTGRSYSIQRINTVVCVFCGVERDRGNYYYTERKQHPCQICDDCFTRKVDKLHKCILCSQDIAVGYATSEIDPCLGCNRRLEYTEYSLFCYLEHTCFLCNQCVLVNMKVCSVCCVLYSDKDQAVIQAKALPEMLVGPRCKCGNAVSKGRFCCPNDCFCSSCHLSNLLISGLSVCLQCNEECTGTLPPSLQCSHCNRSVSTHYGELTVSGICSKGHILCHHCITVQNDLLSCPLCHSPVQGKPISDIKHAQSRLFLACYCESQGEKDLIETECGHIIHYKCKHMLSRCRICEKKLSYYSEPKVETIWKYAR